MDDLYLTKKEARKMLVLWDVFRSLEIVSLRVLLREFAVTIGKDGLLVDTGKFPEFYKNQGALCTAYSIRGF